MTGKASDAGGLSPGKGDVKRLYSLTQKIPQRLDDFQIERLYIPDPPAMKNGRVRPFYISPKAQEVFRIRHEAMGKSPRRCLRVFRKR